MLSSLLVLALCSGAITVPQVSAAGALPSTIGSKVVNPKTTMTWKNPYDSSGFALTKGGKQYIQLKMDTSMNNFEYGFADMLTWTRRGYFTVYNNSDGWLSERWIGYNKLDSFFKVM